MDNPIKQYIQDLIIDTVTAVTHLDTTIYIALPHTKKVTNQKSNTRNILHKILWNIGNQIRRKLIEMNNNNNNNNNKSRWR
jgi:hypothetical protein